MDIVFFFFIISSVLLLTMFVFKSLYQSFHWNVELLNRDCWESCHPWDTYNTQFYGHRQIVQILRMTHNTKEEIQAYSVISCESLWAHIDKNNTKIELLLLITEISKYVRSNFRFYDWFLSCWNINILRIRHLVLKPYTFLCQCDLLTL
jgi:hypothetical protein